MTADPHKKTDTAANRSRYRFIFFAIGVIGTVLMLCTMDISAIDGAAILRLAPVWLPLELAVWAVIYLLHALSWRVVLGYGGARVPFWQLYRVTLSGFALNHVTPMGLIGGEPYRILELKPYIGVERATAVSLINSVLQTFTHILFWLTAAIAYFFVFGLSGGILRTTMMALVLAGAFAAWAFLLFCKQANLVQGIFRLGTHLPLVKHAAARFLERNGAELAMIDRLILGFRKCRLQFFGSVVLEYITRLLEVLEYVMIFWILGANVSFVQTLIALACASLIGTLFFFVPMQLGSREGGMALALDWFRVPASFGVTASLLARIRELFYTAAGIILLLVRSGNRAVEKKGNS